MPGAGNVSADEGIGGKPQPEETLQNGISREPATGTTSRKQERI